jgi:hypothetical protein
MKAFNLGWPVYAIAERESVEKSDAPFVLDYGLLVFGPVTDRELGLLLFSSAERAQQCLTGIQKPDCTIATFRNRGEFHTCVKDFAARKYQWVVFDKYFDGQIIPIEDIIESSDGGQC